MRPIFQVAGGFAATVAIFGAGALFATAILAVEAKEEARPALNMDSTGVWTTEPVRVASASPAPVKPAAQPAPEAPATGTIAAADDEVDKAEQDDLTTAALPEPLEEIPAPVQDQAMIAAHVDWCFSRYRSYDPGDNLYRSYSGDMRACESPYLEEAMVEADAGAEPAVDAAYVEEASLSDGHIQACMGRYRSYDPADNSYQPHGGGPRLQCQP